MLYIIGRTKDQAVLETLDITPDIDTDKYKEYVVSNYGGLKDDYYIINISRDSPDYDKIIKREATPIIEEDQMVGIEILEPAISELILEEEI